VYRIRRFGIIKTATVAAIMYVIVIAIFFVPATLIVGIASTSDGASNVGANVGGLVVAGIIAALLYGLLGFLVTAVACAVYNLAAGWVGGIEVQVEGLQPPQAPPVWGPIGGGPAGRIDAPPPTSTPSSPAQVGWGAPPAPPNQPHPTTDTAPYDPNAPRND
jgi:hypothetical protein